MSHQHTHTIHRHHHHFVWNKSIKPVLQVAPGESIEFEVFEASGGQLSPASTVDDVGRMDFGKINPATGPVYIEGAEPGDVLKVTLLSFKPSGWGWTANIPGFGLLAEEFPDPDLHLWKYNSDTLAPAFSGSGAKCFSSLLPAPLVLRLHRPDCTASCRRGGWAAIWIFVISR
jgi:acetamidase/formamidase